ncbi:MAG: DNA mismatch repair protein MutL, partial [Rikenellaceae bacterium]|nr:DNA mismatch repair protein MutL [Rikenellaceae bacterium]
VLYDRFMAMLGNNSSVSQQLLFPERLAMSLDDLSLMQEFAEEFVSFGFDIAINGDQGIEIKAVPADFIDLPVEQLVYDLLDSMRDGTEGDLRLHKAASTLASIGSMSRSSKTTVEQLQELRRQLLACANHSYSPSGRRVMVVFPAEELRRRLD